MFAGPTMRSASATRRPCSISSRSRIVMPLIDSPPFDSIIVRGIAFRQRPSWSQKTSIENSSPTQCAAPSIGRSCSRGRSRARAVRRPIDVPRAEPAPRLDEHRIARSSGSSSGSHVGGVAIPCSSKKTCAAYLSSQRRIVSGPGTSRTAPEPSSALGEHEMVESASGTISDAVHRRGRGARRRSRGRHPRHERATIGGVQRRCERSRRPRRRRTRLAEGRHDVHALPRTGEEDGRHDRQRSGGAPVPRPPPRRAARRA